MKPVEVAPAPVASSVPDRALDLVDVQDLDPTLQVDLRYASANNFTKSVVYPVARCLLRRDVAAAMVRAHRALGLDGYGLRIWDCYRPFSIQEKFWSLVPDERYVAKPVRKDGVPIDGSKHSRGAACDVTLIALDSREVPMPTDFDDFSELSRRDNPAWAPEAAASVKRLEKAMADQGFTGFPTEWWHFDGPNWQKYPLSDVPLTDR